MEWQWSHDYIEHSQLPDPDMETVTETITKTEEDGDLSDLSDNILRDLCLANHEAHRLIYCKTMTTNVFLTNQIG